MWLNNNSWCDRFDLPISQKPQRSWKKWDTFMKILVIWIYWTENCTENLIRSWSSHKVEFLSEITSFLPLKLNTQIIYFQFKEFSIPFIALQSIGFKFFAKIMTGSCVFCCSNCISFNPTSHLNKLSLSASLCEMSRLPFLMQKVPTASLICNLHIEHHIFQPYLGWVNSVRALLSPPSRNTFWKYYKFIFAINTNPF